MKVHLVDGTYELFRCFYGGFEAQHEGREVGAVRTLLASLLAMRKDADVTHVGIAFDTVIESFRNRLFAGYKTGDGIDPNLWAQFPLIEEGCDALGLVVWRMTEFEADDAIASAAAQCAARSDVEQVRMCSPDKDMAQCVRGARVVMWDRRKHVAIDEPGVVAKYGVPPASIPDLLALVGDEADGIPGLPGFGMKGAAALLMRFGHVDAIPDDARLWGDVAVRGKDKLAAVLAARRADARLYRTLAVLREDALPPFDVDALRWGEIDRTRVEAFGARIGDAKLVERALP